MSKDLLIMIASVLPEEMILDEIEKNLQEYKLLKSKENKEKAQMYMHMWLTKEMANEFGTEKLIKDINNVARLHESLQTKDQ